LNKNYDWKDATGDTILARHIENRKSDDNKVKFWFDDLIPKFKDYLMTEYQSPRTKNPLSKNSAITKANAVSSFFSFHRYGLEIKRGKMSIEEIAKKHHTFNRNELSAMVKVADLEEKTVILTSVCLGIRVGDFIQLLRKPILEAFEDQNQFPLEFEVETEKEGVVAIGHLTEEAFQTLQTYWKTKPESKFCFPSNGSHISSDRANDIFKNTFHRAFPDRKRSIRFHELRGYKMSVLSNAQVNHWAIQRLVGKKLKPDILKYLMGTDLKQEFMRAIDSFQLTGTLSESNHNLIGELKTALLELEKKDHVSQTRIETMHERIEKLEQLLTSHNINFDRMDKMFMNLGDRLVWLENKLKKKEKIKEFT
jgi:hypothetical protein